MPKKLESVPEAKRQKISREEIPKEKLDAVIENKPSTASRKRRRTSSAKSRKKRAKRSSEELNTQAEPEVAKIDIISSESSGKAISCQTPPPLTESAKEGR